MKVAALTEQGIEAYKKSLSQLSQNGQAAMILNFIKTTEIQNQQFKTLETDFLNWLQILGYSTETIVTRKRNIREFLLYLERCNIDTIEHITNEKIQLFTRYLKRRENKLFGSGLMNASINVGLSTVNKFFEYLEQSKKITITPKRLEYLEDNYKARNILSIKEITALYEATFTTEKYKRTNKLLHLSIQQRDRAMLEIYYGCGLRKSEGTDLNVNDILIERKLIFVRKGKGCKERYVPVTQANMEYIKEYLNDGRKYLLNKSQIETVAFFINQSGYECTAEALSNRLDRLDERAGINKKPSLHTLRHSIATHLLQQGMDIEMIQQFLGHASLETTQIYTHIINESI